MEEHFEITRMSSAVCAELDDQFSRLMSANELAITIVVGPAVQILFEVVLESFTFSGPVEKFPHLFKAWAAHADLHVRLCVLNPLRRWEAESERVERSFVLPRSLS
jgi:hypothetical protein